MPKIPKDHYQKPRINTEMINHLMYQIQQIYRINGDLDRRLAAMARAKMDPKVLAAFMVDGQANQKYMVEVSNELDVLLAKIEQEQKQKTPE